MLGGTYRVIGTIESYRRSAIHAYGFFWRYRAIKDIAHITSYRDAIGLYRENAIAVRVIDRSAYDATSRVHAHRQRKKLYLRNGCCIYYLRPSGSAHL